MLKSKWFVMLVLVAGLALGPSRSVMAQAQSDPSTALVAQADTTAPAPAAPKVPFSEAWLAQFGLACVGTAGVAMGATYLAGPTEAMLLFGGGFLTASSNTILFLSLLGQIGAPSCVMGATIAPTALWVYGASDAIWAHLAKSVDDAGSAVRTALGFGGEQTPHVIEAMATAHE